MQRPTWRLILRLIALLIFIISLIWLLGQPGFDPLLAWLSAASSLIVSFFVPDTLIGTYQASETQTKRNRRRMLQNVRSYWIEGVLDNSLHNQVFIDLGIQMKPAAVGMVLRQPDETEHMLPEGTKIADVFDQQGRELLILGEPGSGKTTTMLELARTLIKEAENDDTLPMPVVFNLSSWANERRPLAEWLVDELKTQYQASPKLAEWWVENVDIFPLLDGLDEVKPEAREACVEAINAFMKERRLTVDMVVCSRVQDYEAINARLVLKSAILLQPLSDRQIDDYLVGACTAGEELELQAVRTTLKHNELRKMARTPLMLSVMMLAYQGVSTDSLAELDTEKACRKHLFQHYVKSMFERSNRSDIKLYPRDKTIHYLAWLAGQMVRHSQTVFYIESFQPDRLATPEQKRWYRIGVGLAFVLAVGLTVGLTIVLAIGLAGRLAGGLAVGLAFGLAFALAGDLAGGPEIRIVETLNWSLGKPYLTIGLGVEVVGAFIVDRIVTGVLVFILVAELAFSLPFTLAWGLKSSERVDMRTQPNQGIQHSAWNAVRVWLAGGLAVGLAWGLGAGLVSGLNVGLAWGLTWGLVWGLMLAIQYCGGDAVIKHIVLRHLLWRNGYTPLNYAKFLDYAAERVLLRKVGGGYIFIHRYLLEYFAEHYAE